MKRLEPPDLKRCQAEKPNGPPDWTTREAALRAEIERLKAIALDGKLCISQQHEALETVLRSLASYVGNGGFNAESVDPAIFEEKIRDGIDRLTRVEGERRERAEAQPAASQERVKRLEEALRRKAKD
jgi:hypothetical protein